MPHFVLVNLLSINCEKKEECMLINLDNIKYISPEKVDICASDNRVAHSVIVLNDRTRLYISEDFNSIFSKVQHLSN